MSEKMDYIYKAGESFRDLPEVNFESAYGIKPGSRDEVERLERIILNFIKNKSNDYQYIANMMNLYVKELNRSHMLEDLLKNNNIEFPKREFINYE